MMLKGNPFLYEYAHLLVLSLPISSLEASLVPAQFVAVTLTVYMELRAANASELTTEKDTLLAG